MAPPEPVVSDGMTPEPIALSPESTLLEALETMRRCRAWPLPVMWSKAGGAGLSHR